MKKILRKFIFFTFAFIVAYYYSNYYLKEKNKSKEIIQEVSVNRSAPVASKKQPLENKEPEKTWQTAKKTLGNYLNEKWSQDGILVSLQGKSKSASMIYNFNSYESRINRLRETLKELSPFTHISSLSEFRQPVIQADQYSTQILLDQKYEDVSLFPYGKDTVQYDKNGNLIGFYSSYIPRLEVENQYDLSEERAKEIARENFYSRKKQRPLVREARRLIYVTGWSGTEPVIGRRSYEISLSNEKLIIDASTAAVLYMSQAKY